MKTKRKLVPKSNPHTGDCNVVPLDVADRVLDVNSNVPAKRQRANGSGFISPLLIDVGPSGVQNVPPVGGPALPTTGVSHCTLMSSSCGALPGTGNDMSTLFELDDFAAKFRLVQFYEIDESSGDATHVVRVDNYSSRCPCSGMQSPVVPMFEQPRHVTSIVNNHSRARRDRTRRHPTATASTSSQHATPSGSLCPADGKDGEPPRFLQLYIYDTDNEVDNRLTHFGGDNNVLRRDIVEGLIDLLDSCIMSLVLGNTNSLGDMLGAIVYEAGPENDMDYDIMLEERSGYPKRVNKLHLSYLSLQFPLLFIYGQDGYSKDLKMINRSGSSTEDKRLTMLAYYLYYLHDHANQYNYLSRTGKLFQQYVVTAYCAVEQNRINFIREHQNDIRNEYLSGIYDAINRGDNDGFDCGLRLILPQSFTGGPRYMYSHYSDAFAICCVHGNPLYFITFTCNVNWPEITNYMAQFPLLTTTDRADIVDRVFEMKIHKFVNYLRDAQPFGKVVAVLYTVEFQKRGLPHCHTLLWIDESVRPRRDEDIDMYVSAELPTQHADPQGYRIVSELMMHDGKYWRRRRLRNKSSIGRLAYVHPAAGDLFYQRMLLCHQKGCTSFRGIRTVNEVVYPTCRDACEALGLLQDDQEWEITLQEAALTATPEELRTLLAHILAYCKVSNPKRLWERTWKSMSDGIPYVCSISLNLPNLHIEDLDLEDYMLYEFESCLNRCSKSVTNFGLHLPPEHLMSVLRNKLLMEEKSYDR
ncbi:DNA helicase [Tanacetum coccineum]